MFDSEMPFVLLGVLPDLSGWLFGSSSTYTRVIKDALPEGTRDAGHRLARPGARDLLKTDTVCAEHNLDLIMICLIDFSLILCLKVLSCSWSEMTTDDLYIDY
jgi:hypothetical protein